MGYWEASGKSNEWYTPKFVFDALGCTFDVDVASPAGANAATHVPARHFVTRDSLKMAWSGFIWMNPPFEGRNGIVPWLNKFFDHGNGIALTPDRTSADWWQDAASKADATLFVRGKIQFEKPDGSRGKSPSNGTSLFAAGSAAVSALKTAEPALGILAGRASEGRR